MELDFLFVPDDCLCLLLLVAGVVAAAAAAASAVEAAVAVVAAVAVDAAVLFCLFFDLMVLVFAVRIDSFHTFACGCAVPFL